MRRPSRTPISLLTITLASGVVALGAGCSTSTYGFLDESSDRDGGASASPGSPSGAVGSHGGDGGASAPDGGSGGGQGGGDDGGVTLPDTDGAAPGAGEAGASCSIGSSGALGLIPGGSMAPGTACVSCHVTTNAAKLNVAGTLYSKSNEPDLCLGIPSGAQIVITDAKGTDHTLAINAAGNFYDTSFFGLSMPYKAKVVTSAGSVAMIGAQTNGDCNACHTAAGAQGAAGRIVGP